MIAPRIRFKRFRLRIRMPRHASFLSWEEAACSLVKRPAFNRVA